MLIIDSPHLIFLPRIPHAVFDQGDCLMDGC
jgi:hypothetical protein